MRRLPTAELLLVLFAMAFVPAAKGQSAGRFQVGYNMANISVKNNGGINEANMLSSFNIGFTGSAALAGPLSFEYGLLLTGKGVKQEIYYTNSTTDFYSKRSLNPFYLEIPANLVLRVPLVSTAKLNFSAGPYVAVGLFGKVKGESKFSGITSSFSNNIEFNNDNPFTSNQEDAANGRLRRFDTGLNAGIGIDFSKVNFRLNYGLGLSKIGSAEQNTNDNNKHRVLSLNVGFKL